MYAAFEVCSHSLWKLGDHPVAMPEYSSISREHDSIHSTLTHWKKETEFLTSKYWTDKPLSQITQTNYIHKCQNFSFIIQIFKKIKEHIQMQKIPKILKYCRCWYFLAASLSTWYEWILYCIDTYITDDYAFITGKNTNAMVWGSTKNGF